MKELISGWQVAYMQNSHYVKSKFEPCLIEDILASDIEIIDATVPGNFELDLIKAQKLPQDIYFGKNILEVQKLESTHLWYFTTFELKSNDSCDAFLLFEGIDTAAEIFIDGIPVKRTENMLIPHEIALDGFENGEHELIVHIIPAGIYVRDIPFPATSRAMRYNTDSLLIRKAPYMYGWDIMPRTVSAGLWREVSVVYKSKHRIEEYRMYTHHLDNEKASVTFDLHLVTCADDLRNLSIKIEGVCGDSKFYKDDQFFSVNKKIHLDVDDPKLWWPKNYGEPQLYAVTLTLYYKGTAVDTVSFNAGIRTVELERTSVSGENGTFRFIVNGKPIMVLGTNWVPTDAFPSRHDQYTLRGLELTNELNCNMIRCWGGNAYPGDLFYDYCDTHGILVWQDFSMACGKYPNDDRFLKLIEEESTYVVKRLRSRACLALWSGDNECDYMYVWDRAASGDKILHQKDPNCNLITRKVLPHVIDLNDGFTPFIPSSPYLDEEAFKTLRPAEDHLWGPRDYFKGDFYNKNSVCHFASETGYHGCPAPESLRSFMTEEAIKDRGDNKKCTNEEWVIHAANPETSELASFSYRIPLMTRQVERIFDTAEGDIEEYALKSQISQAEAVKFFIEHFRIQKNYRWGILWWNIIDGWPQISDAIVDWYGTKKIAYHYILRAQTPFAMMIDEPDENGMLSLCAINDSRKALNVSYTVTEAISGKQIAVGTLNIEPDQLVRLDSFKEQNGEYYIIRWSGDVEGINHFTGDIGGKVDFDKYVDFMKKAQLYDKLEGFKKV